MKIERPEWWETVLGIAMLGGAAWIGWQLVTSPESQSTGAWALVAGLGALGAFLAFPVRTRAMWSEIKSAVPMLHDHEEGSGS